MPKSSRSPSKVNLDRRLPVNPRRHRVPPEQRKRVATACNSCNVRRIKCSGDKPQCEQCKTNPDRTCAYPAPIERVSVSKSEYDSLRALNDQIQSLKSQLGMQDFKTEDDAMAASPSEGIPLDPMFMDILHRNPNMLSPLCTVSSPSSSSRAENAGGGEEPPEDERESGSNRTLEGGRMLYDVDGTARYLGKTSGATFLDTLKDFMSTSSQLVALDTKFLGSRGHYQTFDSRPLPMPPDDLLQPQQLPPRGEIVHMLKMLRNFVVDGGGMFQCGGILYWPLDDLKTLQSPDAMQIDVDAPPRRPAAHAHRHLALYHTAFALATMLDLTEPGSKVPGRLGESHYAKAYKILGNPLDITSYTTDDVPALTMMALYLIENNRRDSAYICISTAMHLSIMHGVHRGSAVTEKERRTFWTLYILDRWLSCLMGRPPTVSDDAIKLQLPRDSPGLPPAAGLRAHVELSRISDYIVHSSYRVTQPIEDAPGQALQHVETAQSLLKEWQQRLPDCLKAPQGGFSPDILGVDNLSLNLKQDYGNARDYDRAFCSLHMTHNQLFILTVRPAFLAAVRKVVAGKFLTRFSPSGGEHPEWSVEESSHVQRLRECSESARVNLWLAKRVRMLLSPKEKLLIQELHHVFNAAIILMMHHIVFLNLRTNDPELIDFAISVFNTEASTGSDYAIDCARVLPDLRELAKKLREAVHDHQQAGAHGVAVPHTNAPYEARYSDAMAVQFMRFPGSGHGHGPSHDMGHGVVRGIPPGLVAERPAVVSLVSGHIHPGAMSAPSGRILEELRGWRQLDDLGLYTDPRCMVDA
ncbi:hypothetical protein B0H67DRAFT_588925 [Lasiosphaeris hirsuta]|uniref:Zn(2)-C6 fungal-type domain-containing protein n=1 Tax=Lasiosphaeris hirsuta TaxID=260670 RepID=A0AA40DLC5_9PEZI|nr:hypothetical protein B0H67DRAFT_588925 [Lasiosphaeris hirsuta]